MKRVALAAAAVSMLFAGAASAADLPARVPVKAAPPPAPVANWTGCYVGVNGGGAWRDTSANRGSFTTTGFVDFAGREAQGEFPNFSLNKANETVGGQVGCNWQVAPAWVVGVETDINYTGLKNTTTFAFPATNFDANTQSATQNIPWLGTVRGRVGITPTPSFLLYVTGGLAYARVENSVATIGVPNGFPGVLVGVSSASTRAGWTAGAGGEWAFAPNWSVKLEYLYFDLGTQTPNLNYAVVTGGAGNTINYSFAERGQIARVGVNYKFNSWGGPLVAKY